MTDKQQSKWPLLVVVKIPARGGHPELGDVYWTRREAERLLEWHHGEPVIYKNKKYWIEKDIQERPSKVLELRTIWLNPRLNLKSK